MRRIIMSNLRAARRLGKGTGGRSQLSRQLFGGSVAALTLSTGLAFCKESKETIDVAIIPEAALVIIPPPKAKYTQVGVPEAMGSYEIFTAYDTAEKFDPELGRTVVCFYDGTASSRVALKEACRNKKPTDKLLVLFLVSLLEADSFVSIEPVDLTMAAPLAYIQGPFGYRWRAVQDINNATMQNGAVKTIEIIKRVTDLLEDPINVQIKAAAATDVEETALAIARSTKAEVLYTGSRDHSAINRLLLGSFSHAILHNAQCSVLIAKSPEEEEPQKEPLLDSGRSAEDAWLDHDTGS